MAKNNTLKTVISLAVILLIAGCRKADTPSAETTPAAPHYSTDTVNGAIFTTNNVSCNHYADFDQDGPVTFMAWNYTIDTAAYYDTIIDYAFYTNVDNNLTIQYPSSKLLFTGQQSDTGFHTIYHYNFLLHCTTNYADTLRIKGVVDCVWQNH